MCSGEIVPVSTSLAYKLPKLRHIMQTSSKMLVEAEDAEIESIPLHFISLTIFQYVLIYVEKKTSTGMPIRHIKRVRSSPVIFFSFHFVTLFVLQHSRFCLSLNSSPFQAQALKMQESLHGRTRLYTRFLLAPSFLIWRKLPTF